MSFKYKVTTELIQKSIRYLEAIGKADTAYFQFSHENMRFLEKLSTRLRSYDSYDQDRTSDMFYYYLSGMSTVWSLSNNVVKNMWTLMNITHDCYFAELNKNKELTEKARIEYDKLLK